MNFEMDIRFDHGPEGPPVWFRNASSTIVARGPEDVAEALLQVDQALASGSWVAGYASYELGYALEPRLNALLPRNRRLPLLAFAVVDGPENAAPLEPKGTLSDFIPQWDEATYTKAFSRLHSLIGAGDLYQANLTFPIHGKATGGAEALYALLAGHQPVGYGALVLQEGLPDILSRSPELFFRADASGLIETRPMKGTQPRSADPVEDAKRRAFLASDPKNRAENLMIVDLLRNDISRVAKAGSVKVPELFKVESYETVHQMVSLVQAQLRDDTRMSDILRALFPCGSITGAPKIRAMEVIAELEDGAREAYCGSIGWVAPDGRAEFNVAIRSILLDADRAVLNVGGGVVWDSTAASEYEEALWKARFATSLPT